MSRTAHAITKGLVRETDTGKVGSIDSDALAGAMNRRMGPPPGFGGAHTAPVPRKIS